MNVTFNEETHEYFREDGTRLTHPTEFLELGGLHRVWNKNEAAANFGTYGHKVVPLVITGDLGEVDDAFRPWLHGIQAFVDNHVVEMWESERLVAHPKLGYAGQLDFMGMVQGGPFSPRRRLSLAVPYLLEWKFWATATKAALGAAGAQTAAYEEAYRMETKCTQRPRAVVQFDPALPHGYAVHILDDPAAYSAFKAAISVMRYKERYS